MITKNSTTTGYGWKMAIGIGLVGVTTILTAVIAFADRAGTPVAAANLRLPASIRTTVADLTDALGFGEVVTPMQSSPLGIDAPQGVDVHDLPRGLTDYIRPDSVTPVSSKQPAQLGVDAPQRVDVRDLPRGLTDYIRPDSATPIVQTLSSQLGIDLPYGADVRDLPRGLSDYLRPSSVTSATKNQSAQLGIDLPHGADVRDLPRGLNDYIRHGN